MRYGTSTPAALVERAAEHGQPVLALTDRDGLYGAVKFVQAATAAGIAPVLGVDLAVLAGEPGFRPGSGPAAYGTGHGWGSGAPGWRDVPGALGAEGPSSPRVRTPVRGGAERDPRHPRVTVLARGSGAGLPAGVGWASLCRLVTDTHLSGERGQPVAPRRSPSPGACGGRRRRVRPADRAARARLRRRSGAAGQAVRPGPRPAGRLAAGPAAGALASSRWSATADLRAPLRRGATPPACSGWPTRQGFLPCSPRRCATPTRGRARSSTCSTPRGAWSPSTPATSTGSPTPPTSRAPTAMHAIAREVTSAATAARADALDRPDPGRWRWRAPRTPAATSASARSTCPSPPSLGHRARRRPPGGARAALPRRRSLTRYPGPSEHELHARREPARPTSSRSSPSSATRPTSSPWPRSST